MLSVLKNALLALLVFAALYLIACLPDYWLALARRIRYRGSRQWAICQGTIQEHRIETSRGKLAARYQAVFDYSYNVEGQIYSGSFRSRKFTSRFDAERLLAKYPISSSVMIRSSPKRAQDSLLVLPE